jgi:hypothetical protein
LNSKEVVETIFLLDTQIKNFGQFMFDTHLSQRGNKVKVIYLVEIQGQGFAPFEFANKKLANDYGIGIVSWSGRKWRVVPKRIKITEEKE